MPKIIKGGLPSSGGTIDGPLTITGILTSSKIGVSGAVPTSTAFNPATNSDAAFQADGGFGGGLVLKDGAGHGGMWMTTSGTIMKLGVGGASGLTSPAEVTATEMALRQGTADNGFINYIATVDADATSAISSLTTSGGVTHHIQFQINGTTFWIAGSTTDPS